MHTSQCLKLVDRLRVLVTGENKFIGRALVTELVARESIVRAAVRELGVISHDEDHVVVGEVNTKTDWQDAQASITHVVHLAASAQIIHSSAEDTIAAFRTINTEGTLNLARQAAQVGIHRFVFLSTIKVNGDGREARCEV